RRHTRSKRDWSSDVCSSDLSQSTASCPSMLSPCNCVLNSYRTATVSPARTRNSSGSIVCGAALTSPEVSVQLVDSAWISRFPEVTTACGTALPVFQTANVPPPVASPAKSAAPARAGTRHLLLIALLSLVLVYGGS